MSASRGFMPYPSLRHWKISSTLLRVLLILRRSNIIMPDELGIHQQGSQAQLEALTPSPRLESHVGTELVSLHVDVR